MCHCDAFSVAHRNDFIESENELKGASGHPLLIDRMYIFWDSLGQQSESIQVLKNVAALVGDQQKVEPLRRAHIEKVTLLGFLE